LSTSILIIEDNAEVRNFLRLCLNTDYTVLEAPDGKAGWDIAVDELPGLIITDVMMPEMNGNEFCHQLKNDARTSHIPVIMLTAQTSIDQQLEGLESGADVYLTKPFSVKVLQSYVKNLLRLKESQRQHFSQKIFLEPTQTEVGTVDKNFMERLMQVIEANMNNPEFHVSALAREVGMSTAVLYKKFNALTQTPIGEFIKSLRLKKAALLLRNDKFNIAEVAWEVGFNDRKYFSKEFKKFFGQTPSEYISGPT